MSERGRTWSEIAWRPPPTLPPFFPPHSFATPSIDGHWGDWAHATAFRPAARYSSADPAAVSTRLATAVAAGVRGILIPCRAPTMVSARGGVISVALADATNATALTVTARAAARAGLRVGFESRPYAGRTARTVRDDMAFCIDTVRAAAGGAALLTGRREGDAAQPRPFVLVRRARDVPCRHWRALLDADSQFSVRGTPRDVFLVAEWVRSADGALARCGVDGVATPPLDDAPDTDAIDWGAYPDHWDGMRATAAAAGVAFIATVAPDVDATPTRPGERGAVRARDEGKRYVQAWRQAAHAAPDTVVIDSWNGWADGTQVEEAADRDGGDSRAATALVPSGAQPPHGAPAVQTYDTEDGLVHAPLLYIELTAREAARAARTRPYRLPARLRSLESKYLSWQGRGGEDGEED